MTQAAKKAAGLQSNAPGAPKTAPKLPRTLGPVSDLEKHLPTEWWRTLFNSLYLKTDGDVVENDENTKADIDLLIGATGIKPDDRLLDVCCGQGRHSLALADRGYKHIHGVDRSRYLIRTGRKRNKDKGFHVKFSEGDARNLRLPESSRDCVFLMGNSFGYFEHEDDDIAVLESVKRILVSEGTLVLDLVDGSWMADNFEPRSWEWIDQNHFVNRERSLTSDRSRIISREVITHAEMGVLADQFYAERLYTLEGISNILKGLGFTDITNSNVESISTRGQDLGMMAHRMFITAKAPVKIVKPKPQVAQRHVTVVMGDPSMPDKVKKGGQFNEEDINTINVLKKALKEISGEELAFEYKDSHKNMIRDLTDNPPDFVFNLCDEGYKNDATLELHVPALLEMLGIPYSGAAPGCLALCYNKSHVHAIADAMDIPVPLETYYDPSDQAANMPSTFPALLKPACGDSSVGITQKAVVHNAAELLSYLDYLKEQFTGVPILIQEYLTGSEYSVALIGNPGKLEALPLLEVDYSGLPQDLPPILSYESKWHPDSPYWSDIKYREAEVSEELRAAMVNYSKLLFERLECRDYARFDFRCDADGTPKLLEVNPNPGWCWDGKFNLMAEMADLTYADMLKMIIEAALERTKK